MAKKAGKDKVKAALPGQFNLGDVRNRIIERRLMKPGELLDHPNQWRDHSGRQAEALAGALREIGITDTIKAWYSARAGGKLVTWDGHLRKSLDPNLEWPVDITDLTDEEADYALASHDPISAMAGSDAAALDALLSTVSSGEKAVQDLLTDIAEKAGLYLEPKSQEAPEPDLDRAEELQASWQVQRGQLWQLGKHRLLCGDATCREDVERLMAGQRAALLATDPPYNVDKDYGENVDDAKLAEEYEAFTVQWFDLWQGVSARQIVTIGGNNLALWLRLYQPYHVAPWIKTNAMTHGKVAQWLCWEPVLFFGREWGRGRPNDVFDYPVPPQKAVGLGSLTPYHPCPKPLPMWVDLIENYSQPGAIVADGFDGSGTTIIAAEQTGRVAYVMELEEKFCAVALQRFQSFTGVTPVLVA